MRFAGSLVLVALTMVLVGGIGKALGEECYSTPDEVFTMYPDARAVWSKRLPDHKGEKCWFQAERKVMHRGQHHDHAASHTLKRSHSASYRARANTGRSRLSNVTVSPAHRALFERFLADKLIQKELDALIPATPH